MVVVDDSVRGSLRQVKALVIKAIAAWMSLEKWEDGTGKKIKKKKKEKKKKAPENDFFLFRAVPQIENVNDPQSRWMMRKINPVQRTKKETKKKKGR
jgi:hypothetical protein